MHHGDRREQRTCDVQTLLKVTNANVCAIIDVARCFLATTKGIRTHDSKICGKNARDSARKAGGVAEGDEVR